MAFTPLVGTKGRVKVGSTTVAGITSWRLAETGGTVEITNFESTAHASGVVFRQFLGGLAEGTVEIEGIYDSDATSHTETGTGAFVIGTTMTLDLVSDKANSKGFDTISAILVSFSRGMNFNNQAMSFTASLKLTGVTPTYGTIS